MEKHEMKPLESERLLLRPLSPQDSQNLYSPMSDSATMQFWNEPPHESLETTKHWVEKIVSHPRHCFWSICLQGQDQTIGFIGFLRHQRVPNFIYLLRSEYWRQGLMAEAARGVLTYGFRQLGLDRTEARVQKGNQASQALLQNLGFASVGRQIQQYAHFSESIEILILGLRSEEYLHLIPSFPKAPEFQTLEPVLPVNNVQDTVNYYCHKLGFHMDFLWGDPPIHGAVSYGEWSTQTVRIQFRATQQNSPPRTDGEMYILIEPEIQSLYNQYQFQGVTILKELVLQPWGMQEFAIQDCNGYIIRFGKVGKEDFF